MNDSGARGRKFERLDAAFREGDLGTVQHELGDLEGFPNVVADPAIGLCLTYAIYHSPIELIVALLEAGADPNWPAADGFPSVIAALSTGVDAPGSPARDDSGEIVALLLAKGADVGQRGINDYTPLHLAAEQGDLEAVDHLLAKGADPSAKCRIDDRETPLEVATRVGSLAVAARLEPLTLDIDATDRYSQTALMRAAHKGDAEMVMRLIAQGADLDRAAKYNLTALMLAVVHGHEEIARQLVLAGANTAIRGTGAPGFYDKTAADLAEDRGAAELAAFIRSRAF